MKKSALLACLLAGVTLSAAAQAKDLAIGLKSEATSMDPQFHQLSTNTQVLLNIFEPLTKQDPLQKVTPGLATKWEAVNDTTWRFALRRGVMQIGAGKSRVQISHGFAKLSPAKCSLTSLCSRAPSLLCTLAPPRATATQTIAPPVQQL